MSMLFFPYCTFCLTLSTADLNQQDLVQIAFIDITVHVHSNNLHGFSIRTYAYYAFNVHSHYN